MIPSTDALFIYKKYYKNTSVYDCKQGHQYEMNPNNTFKYKSSHATMRIFNLAQ